MSAWSRRHFLTLAAAATAASRALVGDALTPRADGTPRRPLPFDSDYRPKPLYFAMADAFRGALPR